MSIKNKIALLLVLISGSFQAQEVIYASDSIIKKEPKISFLDSIKATFVKDEMASRVDSLWLNELSVLNQYDEMATDVAKIDVDQQVDYELPTDLLKERLKLMDEKSPFNIEYNSGLENLIKSFLKNRKKSYERLMGISQYYFPMFEEALAKYNIPLEIKYLAIVESALKPKAVSRSGATGLWQFMYETGKQYGLKIDTYVDERSNDLKASDAAARYMQKSFEALGDWELVLASYNSGLGNVTKAIRRSGGQRNFWNIRKHLPRETQGYVPAFLATMYIFEYHKEHGIVPDKAVMDHFATDTIAIKHQISFKQISEILDIPVVELEYFNPEYKRNEIPAIKGKNYFLRLPKNKIAIFASNEDKVYAYANYQESKREKQGEILVSAKVYNIQDSNGNSQSDFVTRTKYHKVRRGDNLTEISEKYSVTVDDLKKWNHLRSNKAPLGRNLKIITSERVAYKTQKDSVKNTDNVVKDNSQYVVYESKNKEPETQSIVHESKPNEEEIQYVKAYKNEKVVTNKEVTKYHKVKKGDNLGEIASQHNVSISDLRKWNKIKGSNISLGESLKIIKNEKVVTTVKKEYKKPVTVKNQLNGASDSQVITYENTNKNEPVIESSNQEGTYYTVKKGDNLGSIAKKHNVSIDDLKKWNNIEGNNINLDSKIKVADISSDNENYSIAKTEIKTRTYKTRKGDNLAKIASDHNITTAELKEWNNIKGNTIKAGRTLIIGKKLVLQDNEDENIAESKSKKNKNESKERSYYVKKGDSLFSIAKKYPGITVSDIKKWNGIKGNELKPGMKLKIIG